MFVHPILMICYSSADRHRCHYIRRQHEGIVQGVKNVFMILYLRFVSLCIIVKFKYNLLYKNLATHIVMFGFLTLEHGTDRLSRNVFKTLPLFVA